MSKKKRGSLGPRILTIDIECSPNLAHVWSLFKQNVSLSQLQETGEVISFAAKWHGQKKVFFYSTFHHGKAKMVEAAYDLLSEADIVVGYNSKGFDMKHLNREFVLAGYTPPAPYQQVDLLLAIRAAFRFTSHKLDHVAQELGLGAKTSHEGHDLWVKCMAGDKDAWSRMRTYNMQDVVLTEALYDRVLPWIAPHPHVGLYNGNPDGCTNCGRSDALQPRGYARTNLTSYQRLRCGACGKWNRGAHKVTGTSLRGI